jgi:hypothetical protein
MKGKTLMTDQTAKPTLTPRTVADVLADLNLDEALENAITPTCEARDDNDEPMCDERATTLCILSCGHSAFFCEEHTVELRDSIETHRASGTATLACEYPITRSPWHPRPMTITVRFERIAS